MLVLCSCGMTDGGMAGVAMVSPRSSRVVILTVHGTPMASSTAATNSFMRAFVSHVELWSCEWRLGSANTLPLIVRSTKTPRTRLGLYSTLYSETATAGQWQQARLQPLARHAPKWPH